MPPKRGAGQQQQTQDDYDTQLSVNDATNKTIMKHNPPHATADVDPRQDDNDGDRQQLLQQHQQHHQQQEQPQQPAQQHVEQACAFLQVICQEYKDHCQQQQPQQPQQTQQEQQNNNYNEQSQQQDSTPFTSRLAQTTLGTKDVLLNYLSQDLQRLLTTRHDLLYNQLIPTTYHEEFRSIMQSAEKEGIRRQPMPEDFFEKGVFSVKITNPHTKQQFVYDNAFPASTTIEQLLHKLCGDHVLNTSPNNNNNNNNEDKNDNDNNTSNTNNHHLFQFPFPPYHVGLSLSMPEKPSDINKDDPSIAKYLTLPHCAIDELGPQQTLPLHHTLYHYFNTNTHRATYITGEDGRVSITMNNYDATTCPAYFEFDLVFDNVDEFKNTSFYNTFFASTPYDVLQPITNMYSSSSNDNNNNDDTSGNNNNYSTTTFNQLPQLQQTYHNSTPTEQLQLQHFDQIKLDFLTTLCNALRKDIEKISSYSKDKEKEQQEQQVGATKYHALFDYNLLKRRIGLYRRQQSHLQCLKVTTEDDAPQQHQQQQLPSDTFFTPAEVAQRQKLRSLQQAKNVTERQWYKKESPDQFVLFCTRAPLDEMVSFCCDPKTTTWGDVLKSPLFQHARNPSWMSPFTQPDCALSDAEDDEGKALYALYQAYRQDRTSINDKTLSELQLPSGYCFHLDAPYYITLQIAGQPQFTIHNASIQHSLHWFASTAIQTHRVSPPIPFCNLTDLPHFYHPDDPTKTPYSPTTTIAELGIGPKTNTITLGVEFQTKKTASCGMQVFVKTLMGKTLTLDVTYDAPIQDLKVLICDQEGIDVAVQQLNFSGRQLQNGHTLAHYNVQKESTLYLTVRMRGC